MHWHEYMDLYYEGTSWSEFFLLDMCRTKIKKIKNMCNIPCHTGLGDIAFYNYLFVINYY